MRYEKSFYPLKGAILNEDFVLYLNSPTTNFLLVLTPHDTGNGLNPTDLSGQVRLSIRHGWTNEIISEEVTEI